MNDKNRNNVIVKKLKGFTLIELIIVIAILSIIAIIIIPRVMGVKDKASEGVNNHNIRIVQEELENYRTKNETYPIAITPSDLLAKFNNSSEDTIFLNKLPTYKSGKEIIKTYKCYTGATYSITFNDDSATTIYEADTKYSMNQDTDTNNLFK